MCMSASVCSAPIRDLRMCITFSPGQRNLLQVEFNAAPMKDALGWAKSAITSKEGAPQMLLAVFG